LTPETQSATSAETRDAGLGSKYFPLTPGTVFGRFLIECELGRGAQGIVYQATDLKIGRRIALKTIARHSPLGPARAPCREAALLARVHSPYVVTLFDVLESHDADVLVLELVDGPRLDAGVPMKTATWLRLARHLAKGLHAVHTAGIVHSDLKPTNLRLDASGRLKILDFGVAQAVRDRPIHGNSDWNLIAGTPPYMSPEQRRGLRFDARSDIWSAGAVLFELATGRRAPDTQAACCHGRFGRRTVAAVCSAHGDLPPLAARVIGRALQVDPSMRWQSASDMLAALAPPRVGTPTCVLRARHASLSESTLR
jgi:serine/threonine-protein kinase